MNLFIKIEYKSFPINQWCYYIIEEDGRAVRFGMNYLLRHTFKDADKEFRKYVAEKYPERNEAIIESREQFFYYEPSFEKRFWFSMKPKNKCLFSRRNGYVGRIVFGYSICLRLFGKIII